MMGITKIDRIRASSLSNLKTGDSQMEVHVPTDVLSNQLNDTLVECMRKYMGKHKNVKSTDELCLDARIVFLCDAACSNAKGQGVEYALYIAVWQITDEVTGEDTAELYKCAPVSFGGGDSEKVRLIVWNALGAVLFSL